MCDLQNGAPREHPCPYDKVRQLINCLNKNFVDATKNFVFARKNFVAVN
ncbi:MAG: hypothetical protein ACI898_001563 [Flavobacteriales bacterium]|jgi:hypothetical protein